MKDVKNNQHSVKNCLGAKSLERKESDHNTESPAKYRKNLTKLENMGFIWKF